ncbi:MAG TPA: M1 family aminopeptidase [bacterium]|nr:M1 family aminopeptidase [bacterium]
MSRLSCSSIMLGLLCVALVILPSLGLAKTSDAVPQDKPLFKAIWRLQEAVLQNGPDSITFPWDPSKRNAGEAIKRPDFTSYYARTAKIGEEPKVRTDGGRVTSTIFVGSKKVGERFKVENWRVSWEQGEAGYIAKSKDVIQSFDELCIPFDQKEPAAGKSFNRDVFEFEEMQFAHDCMRFSIKRGKLVLVKVEDKPLAAFISGVGELFYKPPKQLASDVPDSDRETQQLEHHLKVKELEGCAFGDTIVWGHPDWMRTFLDKLDLHPVKDTKLQRGARKAFFERLLPTMSRYGAAFGGEKRPICLVPRTPDFFYLEFDTTKHDLLSYTYDPSAVSEVRLAGRRKRQLSKNKLRWFKTYCEYDDAAQRKEKTRHELQHECKDRVKTTSWSVDVKFEKGKLDRVKKGKFRIIFEYETLKPNATEAVFEFWRLDPTALTDAGGNDILFFDMGSELLVPVDPVDCAAGRMNVLYAEGVEFSEWQVPIWIKRFFGITTGKIASCMDGWLPDTGYLDCTQFDLAITVPEKFRAAGVGRVVSEAVADGYRTKKWVGGRCVRFPGFVAGDFRVFDFDVAGKPLWVFGEDGSLARKYVWPEIASSLQFYGKLFGEYPYSKLAVCPVNWSHGRGFATLLTVTGFSSASYLGNEIGVGDWQAGLYCHEVSHQWWGNIVGWFSPADQWLSEGFAEMSTLMYLQSARDNDSVKGRLKDWAYNAKRLDDNGPICLGYARLGWRAGYELMYHKGAYVMHMLRMMVGDEAMIRILRTFVEQFTWRRATTSDFRQVCELALGREQLIELGGEPSLGWFFDEWIYGTGYPEYEYSWSERKSKSGLWEVTFKVKQVGKKLFKMPLPIWIFTKDGKRYLSRKLVHEKEHEFVLTVPSKPKTVELDPFHNVLSDVKEVKAN